MREHYIKWIVVLLISIILSFILYYWFDKIGCKILSGILGNIGSGLTTGFVILLITNLKNSLIYKNDNIISDLRKLIDRARECEIKCYKLNNLPTMPIIELINLSADITLFFNEVYNYNSKMFELYKYEMLEKECNEMTGELSEIIYLLNITHEEYSCKFEKELFKKIVIIINIRKELQKDLNLLERENQKINESIM